MNDRLCTWLTVGLLAFASASSAMAGEKTKDSNSITGSQLVEQIKLGKAPLILDVRSEQEYAEGHIPGAVNIPYDQLGDRLGEIEASKTDAIVVHCKSGYRAGIAEKTLREAGYSNVLDLDGHMKGWQVDGHPIEVP